MSDSYEEGMIEFEAARNEALKRYSNARPQLFITREKECFFEAGFRMAWDLLKESKRCPLYIDYTKDCQALKDNELSRQGIDPRSVR
ncbi:hypothetical protein KAR91_32860 [Candidatus Pacearchaeota archaeon]|nr:hypothetical protein [Candidatus Pacearchaeota archaeon]